MSFSPRLLAPLALLLFAGAAASEQPATAPDAAKVEFFEKKVRPILADHCYALPLGRHQAGRRACAWTTATACSPAATTARPSCPASRSKSLLLSRVTQKDEKRRMPLEGKHLTDEQVADLTTVDQGRGRVAGGARARARSASRSPSTRSSRRSTGPGSRSPSPTVPAVKDAAWPKDDVDRFILAALEAKGLKPVGDADKLTLIRRVTFDLTGLPPTPAEIDAFLKDDSPEGVRDGGRSAAGVAAFGERWGRHWLDVARYGEIAPGRAATSRTRTPGGTATTSSTRSTPTCRSTASSASRSPATCCPPRTTPSATGC